MISVNNKSSIGNLKVKDMSKIWRLINTGSHNGFYNMAADEAIAIACKEGRVPPTLRFYTWDPSCISIGYFQKVNRLLTQIGLEGKNTEIVRRVTGGRAVFHGNDLSYSIVCNTGNRLFPRHIMGTYNTIAEAFLTGLKYLGITADPIDIQNMHLKTRNYHHSPLCFTTALGHEMSVNNRKLIGSAQRRWSDVFLQHGSILMTRHQKDVGLTSISLCEILGNDPDIKAITAAICTGFFKTLGMTLIQGCLTKYEMELTEKLVEEKYSTSSWNERYV